MNDVLRALRTSSSYGHFTSSIEVIETHLSWIFLTGDFAYKLKKPIKLDFVDFSTLEKRCHYCHEELRLNRKYSEEIYIGVLPIVRKLDGSIRTSEVPVATDEIVLDWVVKMHEFDQADQADQLVASNKITLEHFFEFGSRLARQHADVSTISNSADEADAILENFVTLDSIESVSVHKAQIKRIKEDTKQRLSQLLGLLRMRRLLGFVRECHGDLHLANIMLFKNHLQAFDCLEFNRTLSEIDVWNDVAFLVMDCCVRNREDLAYAFIDGYLDFSGDYEGTLLLNHYSQYRSLVRAKVAAIAFEQSDNTNIDARDRLQMYLDWADDRVKRDPGKLLVCCGLSGSGKSYWSAKLVSQIPAIRIRSDVFRKVASGLATTEHSGSGLGSGLYSSSSSVDLYADMTRLADALLQQGENVIIDATCLMKAQREGFLQVAKRLGAKSIVVHMTAPEPVLRERISSRHLQGLDASEADTAVLDWQLQRQELPQSPEPVIVADTTQLDLGSLIGKIAQKLKIDERKNRVG